jgi:uncharacterized damage-inducible protein DinB
MTLDYIRWLYAFNRWANARYLDSVQALSPDQLARHVESSFPSALATCAHMVAAEWIWLRRWQGESPSGPPDWLTAPSPQRLREVLDEVESERDTFLAALTPERLEQAVQYRLMSGAEGTRPLGALLVHVVNHATFHRGQLATILRQIGAVPPATDLLVFAGEQSP